MNPEQLLHEWQGGEQTGMRPARIQALRDDLINATGMAIPRRRSEIESMMESQQIRGVVTRNLRDAVGVEDDGESEATDGSEPDETDAEAAE